MNYLYDIWLKVNNFSYGICVYGKVIIYLFKPGIDPRNFFTQEEVLMIKPFLKQVLHKATFYYRQKRVAYNYLSKTIGKQNDFIVFPEIERYPFNFDLWGYFSLKSMKTKGLNDWTTREWQKIPKHLPFYVQHQWHKLFPERSEKISKALEKSPFNYN